jgi:hypothetical protein
MAGQLTIDTLRASSGVLATQNGMTGIARAWVNFNGSTASIRGSFNVSSITKNGTGDYLVNFTTAMPNTNYCIQKCDNERGVGEASTTSTTACNAVVRNTSGSTVDASIVYVTVFSS